MDENLLEVKQVLLLENLTYMGYEKDKKLFPDLLSIDVDYSTGEVTVGEVLEKIDMEVLDDNQDYGSFMTGADWKNIKEAILADPILCNMKILTVEGDTPEAGALSAVFVNTDSKEAIVAFRGTREYEWKDNFLGGAVTILEEGASNVSHDGVSTAYQEKALKWYQSLDLGDYETITVTGHSKGGNKAKYITILDDSVTRCLSFDGQGFSDAFFEKYERRIAERAYAITNYNVDFDFVNLLLNDVGEKIYYVGFDYGKGLLLEAHCPNTFFKHGQNGKVEMVIADGQAELMMELDKYLHSYLRGLPEEKKIKAMELVGEIAEAFFKGELKDGSTKVTEIIDRQEDGWEIAFGLALYTADYIQRHPEFVTALENGVIEFGFDLFLPDEFGTMAVKIKKIRDLITPQNFFDNVTSLKTGIMEGSRYDDLQITPVCRPLERNRVFSMNEMLEIGERGQALMQTGSEACMVWDEQLSRLEEFLDLLPAEVDASALKNTLAQRGGPFYSDEYERMGTIIYNTTHRIAEDMQHYDAETAKKINEITGNLDAITLNINKLRERIWEA